MKKFALSFIFFLSFYLTYTQEYKNELLISAIINGNYDSVRVLLKQGADVNYETIYGITPVLFAVEKGDTNIIKLLLENGANINVVPPYDLPAIDFVIVNFRDTLLKFLLENGANPNLKDRKGITPLFYAIERGNYLAADLLLFYGAKVDEKVRDWTPLQFASLYNDTLLINMFIYYGADVNLRDTIGYSALHIASQYNNLLATEVLMKNGARLDLLSKDLASPIDISVYFRNNKVFDSLIQYKVDFDNLVLGRFNAFDVAVFQRNYHARRVLSKMGLRKAIFHIDFFAGIGQVLNFSDYLFGVDIGMLELYSNVSMSLGFYKRLFDKRIIIEQSPNVFYQYWESRSILRVQVKRSFYLFYINRVNNYFSVGLNYLISNSLYRGMFMQDLRVDFRPELGYNLDYDRFSLNFSFTLLPKPLVGKNEFYTNLGFYYYFPTNLMRLRTKKKLQF